MNCAVLSLMFDEQNYPDNVFINDCGVVCNCKSIEISDNNGIWIQMEFAKLKGLWGGNISMHFKMFGMARCVKESDFIYPSESSCIDALMDKVIKFTEDNTIYKNRVQKLLDKWKNGK